jgi:hypothetical protein
MNISQEGVQTNIFNYVKFAINSTKYSMSSESFTFLSPEHKKIEIHMSRITGRIILNLILCRLKVLQPNSTA